MKNTFALACAACLFGIPAWAIDFEHDKIIKSVIGVNSVEAEPVEIDDIVVNDVMPPLTDEERARIENRRLAPPDGSESVSVAPGTMPAGSPVASNIAAAPDDRIARAVFTSEILNREPADELQAITEKPQRVYFFTELHGMRGKTAVHQWRYQGEMVAEKHFQVGAQRWRIWSSKDAEQMTPGTWTVTIANEKGEPLAQREIVIGPSVSADLHSN